MLYSIIVWAFMQSLRYFFLVVCIRSSIFPFLFAALVQCQQNPRIVNWYQSNTRHCVFLCANCIKVLVILNSLLGQVKKKFQLNSFFLLCRYAVTRAFCIAFVMTFFSIFDIPVFWPILLFYFFMLFFVTMKRQIQHMIKYKYLPFSFGKQVNMICNWEEINNNLYSLQIISVIWKRKSEVFWIPTVFLEENSWKQKNISLLQNLTKYFYCVY
jgi:Rer1 family